MKYGTCFDNLIDQRMNLNVSKNLSFIKPEKTKKTKEFSEEEKLIKHQKKLLRSPRDALIDNTKI